MTDRFLVSTEWFAERADSPDVRVLDVSGFHDDHGNNLAHDH